MKTSKGMLASVIAGANTLGLIIIQKVCAGESYLDFATSCTPLVITPIIYAGDWLFALLDIQSAETMRARGTLKKSIKFLKKELLEASNTNRDTQVIEKELNDAIVALSNLMKVKESKTR
ncbi:hypothetical protein CWC17_13005 [Pseudoalteromonas sp. S3785]|uniref:hypothetical protein n=1 Tax=Pseudoalteromonas sp. S3785 TaxID=579545 RepID=UPI00110A602A|nr:hypothetical protein [Pseudoalteromonas sp. S3785]TMO72738.1 hypothetical protein CWC17_13005 [Pseudoalteromonas sp. S3785]